MSIFSRALKPLPLVLPLMPALLFAAALFAAAPAAQAQLVAQPVQPAPGPVLAAVPLPASQPPAVPTPLPSFDPLTGQIAQPDLLPAPVTLQRDDPWLYRGSDIPQDKQWLFGELPNGLRYAVRDNGVPPGQMAIRIRIDAGSLNETDEELGFAHLLEHLTFRESKYLAAGEAIPRWQRLGATFGSDTNAQTTPTQTVYQLDLPNAGRAALEESMRLLSGMIREPALSEDNLKADVPIVQAELRESGGAPRRISEATRTLYFAGQRLAERSPAGSIEMVGGASAQAVRAFHTRWYRPENTEIVAVGDVPPEAMASLIERYFTDWKVPGAREPAPDFGQPMAPAGADSIDPGNPAAPVGAAKVLVEPDLPRSITWAILRPWEQVVDNLEYNRGLMINSIAQAIINRRLEARARAGGSYLAAGVSQDDISRSVDGTFITVTPLDSGWQQAMQDARSVIADAILTPPTQEEIDRELAEFDVIFANMHEQSSIQAGAKLADDLVMALDIRETVASPETVLEVFRSMRDRFTPSAVHAHTQALFKGTVSRVLYVTPAIGEADEEDLRQALLQPVEADGSARIAATSIEFSELPQIGEAADPVKTFPIGVNEMEQLDYANGVHALLWKTSNEPGRATVRVRFGAGYRAFSAQDMAYVGIGRMAFVGSGLGPLGEEELDRISTGRKLGFDFDIGDGVFTLQGRTRPEDVADQLYLFAAKLAMPRWDVNPVLRAKAALALGYESFSSSPMGVIARDLDWLLADRDPRFRPASPEQLENATPEGFRAVWEPLLRQGPVEVMVFGDFDEAVVKSALARTFGALPAREPISAEVLARGVTFPKGGDAPVILYHRGEPDQAVAALAWPTGGGAETLPRSRQLEILTGIFSSRLLDAMREQSGASYSPNVGASWPIDLENGGNVLALAQLPPAAVPVFFAKAQEIAADLVANGPSVDEVERVTEPNRQFINRALTGHGYWMSLVEGATTDLRRIIQLPSLYSDFTEATPEAMQALAARYFVPERAWRLAVIPQGQKLAVSASPAAVGR